MRTRLVGFLFVIGMVVVGTAAAGLNWSTHASGSLEVPPRDTSAQSQAIFHLSKDGSELEYKLIASNIENVVAAHIHMGGSGVNGPIVAFLYGTVAPGAGRTNGALAEGTIRSANLIGPLAGKSLADLVQLMDSGGAYVNVHTNDGVDPANTGPGDFPGGEVRGDMK